VDFYTEISINGIRNEYSTEEYKIFNFDLTGSTLPHKTKTT